MKTGEGYLLDGCRAWTCELVATGIVEAQKGKMMSDLISRQAAIDALAKNMPSLTTPDGCGKFDHDIQVTDEAYVDCMQIIHELPSAQPERKKGKWIPHEDEDGEHYGDKCSECGEWYVMPYGKTNFCPNCGADMRGEHDE